MARYNEIQVGRFNRFLQKFLSMKGDAPAPTLGSDILVHIPLEEIGVENRYLLGWDRFGAAAALAGVALVNSVFRLRNPTSSNVIAVIERVSITAEGTADRFVVEIGAQQGDLATIVSSGRLDSRGRPAATSIFSATTNIPGIGTPIDTFRVGVNSTFLPNVLDHQEISLVPGDSIQWRSVSNNIAFDLGIQWRERFLEESERA